MDKGHITILVKYRHHHHNCVIPKAECQVPSTHFPLDKMAAISQTKKFCILIKISQKFVPKGPTDNNPAMAQTMAWCQIGTKPSSEPMLTQFIDAYMQH